MTLPEKLMCGLVIIAVAVHLYDPVDHQHRNFEILPEMVEPVSHQAQDESTVFADGKTLQTPPPGTIARGHMPLRVGETLLEMQGNWKDLTPAQQAAWDALKPATEATPKDLPRGEAVYRAVCATCHGGAGQGDGAVTKRGVPPPPSLKADNAKSMSDGRVFRMITRGEGNMPSHAVSVTRKDRWKVIAYIRTMQ